MGQIQKLWRRKSQHLQPQQIKKQQIMQGGIQTKGILTYKFGFHLKDCHVELLSKVGKSNGFSLNQNWINFGMHWLITDIVVWDIPTFLQVNNLIKQIKYNSQPTIIKQIEHIKFPSLKRLQLDGNNIQSLQLLERIQLPLLTHLSIDRINNYNHNFSNNRTRSVKSIRKINCPNLQSLTIYAFQTQQVWTLSQLHCKNYAVLQVFSTIKNKQLQKLKFYRYSAKFQGSPHLSLSKYS